MADLGRREVTAVIDTLGNGGNWTATLDPALLSIPEDFLIYRMFVKGPVGSTVIVALDNIEETGTPNGWLNEWDPNQPIYVRRGQTVTAKWNSNVTPAAFFRIWCREVPPNY
jgi:hypothetical protein